jgi:transposase-like protein
MVDRTFDGGFVARVLRELDLAAATPLDVSTLCDRVGIAPATYYRWHRQYAHLVARAEDGRQRLASTKGIDGRCVAHQDEQARAALIANTWRGQA